MRNTNITSIRTLAAAAGVLGLCYAAPAAAQAPTTESVIIVLDQSGSMARQGISPTDATVTRWDDATAAAVEWITNHYRSTAIRSHEIAIWGYQDDAGEQLWPAIDGSNCPDPTDVRQLVDGGGAVVGSLCRMPNDVNAYDDLTTLLSGPSGALYALHPPAGGGPQTPLADGLCQVIDTLRTIDQTRSVILQSDGNENSSDGICDGDPVAFDAAFELDPAVQDWGFPAASWQAKVLRAAARFPQSLATSTATPLGTGTTASSDWCQFFGGNDPLGVCPAGPGGGLNWKVDVHFSICDNSSPGVDCTDFPRPPHWETSGLFAFSAFMTPASGSSNPIDSESQSFSFFAAAAPMTLASLPTSSVSIPLPEFLLFETLASSTPEGSLRTFARNDGTVYGTNHTLPADVDDSGCVDQADLAIVRQSDVFHQRAELPLEIATRADITRDGWVNFFDVEMLLAPENWGMGCLHPPAHPEGGASCWNGVLDGDETDTDCGGSACEPCADGGGCFDDSDCATSPCVDGTCGTVAQCTAETAIDLGVTGAQKTVPNNACVKIHGGRPSWWGTNRNVLLQTTAGGTFPVPFSFTSSCTNVAGVRTFTGSWQSQTFGPTSVACPTLIQLQGSGTGNVSLVYYGQ